MSRELTETCSAFLARLTTAFDVHSSLSRKEMGANLLETHEVHLKEHFLSKLKPEITAGAKKTCISWKTASLQEILNHAEHAEELIQQKEQDWRGVRQKKLDDTQLTMFQALTGISDGWGRGMDRGRGRGKGRRGEDRVDRNDHMTRLPVISVDNMDIGAKTVLKLDNRTTKHLFLHLIEDGGEVGKWTPVTDQPTQHT